MAEIWHRRGVAATGHMARAKALASLPLACHESAGRNNDANCFRVRLHPGEPQGIFSYSQKNSMLLEIVDKPYDESSGW
jgi:hypothetical protein